MQDDTATLTTSLLSSRLPEVRDSVAATGSNAMTMEWSNEVARRVPLLVPMEYDPYQDPKSRGKCFLQFDQTRKLLVVVSESTGSKLGIIDPDDVIGVNVEIELASTEEEQRSSAVRPTTTTDDEPSERAYNEPALEIPVDTQGSAVITLFAYPKRDLTKESIFRSCGFGGKPKSDQEHTPPEAEDDAASSKQRYGHRYKHHHCFLVAPAEDMTDLSTLVGAIWRIIQPQRYEAASSQQERLLVLANPCAGKKTAVEEYNSIVRPMLDESGIEHDFLVTRHARHAEEIMRERAPMDDAGADDDDNNPIKDLSEYSGIVTIGGDGIVHEVIQGIHSRSDRIEVLKRIKLGMIGAGTSNGLSATLAHASNEKFSSMDSAFMVAKGKTSYMDLSHYETLSKSYTSFLTFSWAIIADIDIESELLHWLGFLRMDVWGAWRTLALRKYRAKFAYLPPRANSSGKNTVVLPPLNEPLPNDEGWVQCEDDFILFWASQVTHAGEKMFQSPPCKIDDGLFHIFIVRGTVSRLRLALILIVMEHGGHVNMEGVEFVECVAYRLEPISPGSFNDLDGEVIEPGPVQGLVLPSAIRAYCNETDSNCH